MAQSVPFMPPKRNQNVDANEPRPSPDARLGVAVLADTTSKAMEIMAKAPPGTVPFIFALMALFFAASVVMWVTPKNAPIKDIQPILYAFFGLIVVVLVALMINGGIHRRGERLRLREHEETFTAIRRMHGV